MQPCQEGACSIWVFLTTGRERSSDIPSERGTQNNLREFQIFLCNMCPGVQWVIFLQNIYMIQIFLNSVPSPPYCKETSYWCQQQLSTSFRFHHFFLEMTALMGNFSSDLWFMLPLAHTYHASYFYEAENIPFHTHTYEWGDCFVSSEFLTKPWSLSSLFIFPPRFFCFLFSVIFLLYRKRNLNLLYKVLSIYHNYF